MTVTNGANACARSRSSIAQHLARASVLMLMACVMGGCAPMVKSQPAALAPAATVPRQFTLQHELPVKLATGYTRAVPALSQWRESGRLPQGVVYRPLNTVFAVEGRNIHEAWLVVADGLLVGFYLPGEARLSLLDTPLQLPLGENQ